VLTALSALAPRAAQTQQAGTKRTDLPDTGDLLVQINLGWKAAGGNAAPKAPWLPIKKKFNSRNQRYL
jgi:hypothetical protein